MDLTIASIILVIIISIKTVIIPIQSYIRKETIDINQINIVNKILLIMLTFYFLLLIIFSQTNKNKGIYIYVLAASIFLYIVMLMMLVYRSKQTDLIYCKTFCKDKNKKEKMLVSFHKGIFNFSNIASVFVLFFYIVDVLYLCIFGVVATIAIVSKDSDKTYQGAISMLSALAIILMIILMFLHSQPVKIGNRCQTICNKEGLARFKKNGSCYSD